MSRESDIQELCKKVLEIELDYNDDEYEYVCPFCLEAIFVSYSISNKPMEEIKHDTNCAYLIAKDLTTKRTQ